ncbi:ATP-binding protein [Citrobacter sp. R56]|uniref:two-component system sensor histidine kinase PgtB n=1 Tax=Citrobacter sp. R56 TaxID=1573676 RepID=UPI00193B936F|nr:ATP-binding protein [Citrobacter sp. R56]QRG79574.1 HAMP domain-containing protein [Citrobacter sp. R56]
MKRLLTIGTSLRLAFAFSAILTLFVSVVSLYSWHEQNSQVRYALDDYFPRIQASFLFEENLTALVNEFNELQQTNNTNSRMQVRMQIEQRLQKIQAISPHLDPQHQNALSQQVINSRKLLDNLDKALYDNNQEKEKLDIISSRINWLHDDFNTELNSLTQDLSWQQSSLLNQLSREKDRRENQILQKSLHGVQDELQLVFTLSHIEAQIVDTLKEIANTNDAENESLNQHINYLNYLKHSVDENVRALSVYSSTITLHQTVYSLLELGTQQNYLPGTLATRQQAQQTLESTIREKERVLMQIRGQLEMQLGNSHQQLQTFNLRLEKIMQISGLLIFAAMVTALLFVILVNYFYIRPRMIRRFRQLNDAVVKLSNGELNADITVSGTDELGRIANLLRQTIEQINQQQRQLELEICERIATEKHLRTAQSELIQTAKLAVVGQTMTTLAHEINQPLNAMSMYLFSADRALAQQDVASVKNYVETMRALVERIDNIVKRLRNFARRRDSELVCEAINLQQVIESSWELLALKHRPLKATLSQPSDFPPVYGDDVLIQQVLVNLFTNALEARQNEPPSITIDYEVHASTLTLYVADNGKGWPLQLADRLLMPFTTDKPVGLGIGLSISHSIMHQCQGELDIASTLDRHALVILRFGRP